MKSRKAFKKIIVISLTVYSIGIFLLLIQNINNIDNIKSKKLASNGCGTNNVANNIVKKVLAEGDDESGIDTGEAPSLETWYICMQDRLNEYLDQVIKGLQEAGLGAINVGTPVWNTSNQDDWNGFTGSGGGNYSGPNNSKPPVVMANVYNVDTANGLTISKYFQDLIDKNKGSKEFILTEVGMNEFATGKLGDRAQAVENLKNEMAKAAQMAVDKGLTLTMDLFAARGSGGGDWPSYELNPDEIKSIAQAVKAANPKAKLGINPGAFLDQMTGSGMGGYLNQLEADGILQYFDHIVGIISSTMEYGKANAEIQAANARGLSVTLRVGVGTDSGGFDDPQALVDWIKDMVASDKSIDLSQFSIIGGPNEPDLEGWLALSSTLGDPCGIPLEKLDQYKTGKCGNKYGMEALGMKTTATGFFKLWKKGDVKISKEGQDGTKATAADLEDLSLQSVFKFSATGESDHTRFDYFVNFFKGKLDTINEMTQDLAPPVLVRSMIPGAGLPETYDQKARKYVSPKEYDKNGKMIWNVKKTMEKLFTSSKSTIENISLVACIQQVDESENPIEGTGYTFPTTGTIDMEEPASIEDVSKTALEITRRLAGIPGDDKVYRFQDKETASNSRVEYANNDKKKSLTSLNQITKPSRSNAEGEIGLANASLGMSLNNGTLSLSATYTKGEDCGLRDSQILDITLTGSGSATPAQAQVANFGTSTDVGMNSDNVNWTISSGMGGFGAFQGVSLPQVGDSVKVSLRIFGGPKEYNGHKSGDCPQEYWASCTITKVPISEEYPGGLNQTCSSTPPLAEPIPVNCADPCTWAPWTVKSPGCLPTPKTEDPPKKPYCVNGTCFASKNEAKETLGVDFLKQMLDVCENTKKVFNPIKSIFKFLFRCSLKSPYIIAVAPTGLANDYALNRETDQSFTNAITAIPGNNGTEDRFYKGNVYTEGTVQVNLEIQNDKDSKITYQIRGFASGSSFQTYFQKLAQPHITANCAQVQSLNIPGVDMYEPYKEPCGFIYDDLMAGNLPGLAQRKAPAKPKSKLTLNKKDIETKANRYIKQLERTQKRVKPKQKVYASTGGDYKVELVQGTISEYRKALLILASKYPEESWKALKGQSMSSDFKKELRELVEKYEGTEKAKLIK